MRFKTFLLEGWRSTVLEPEEAFKILKTKCSEAMSLDEPLVYRGMMVDGSKETFHLSKPSQFERTSANTSNEYTVLIDNSSAWNDYPKRSRSLICGNIKNMGYAEGFGRLGMILPFNGAKFGVCPSKDFWVGFKETFLKYGLNDLDEFNYILRDLFKKVDIELDRKNKDYDKLVAALEAGEDWLRDNDEEETSYDDKQIKSLFKTVIDGSEYIVDFLHRILDPKKNNFEISDYLGLKKYQDIKREVWTDSDCIIIFDDHNSMKSPIKHFLSVKERMNET